MQHSVQIPDDAKTDLLLPTDVMPDADVCPKKHSSDFIAGSVQYISDDIFCMSSLLPS